MATFTLFDEFMKYMGDGTIDLDSDTFKVGLTNTAPTAASDTIWTDVTEITAQNGYSAGGATLATVTWTETGAGLGIWKWSSDDAAWTASGGSFGPFRYAVVYDDSPTSPADPLVGYLDNGSSLTINDGSTFTIDVQTDGYFQVSEA